MYALYSLLTAVGMLLLSPYFLVRGLIHGKYLDNIPERLGWRFPRELRRERAPGAPQKSIWIHAVSVGEVLAVLPLAKQLKATIPGAAAGRFHDYGHRPETRARTNASLPMRSSIFRWIGKGRCAARCVPRLPASVIVVETEIWPNFLRECRRADVPVIFVNGRLSERSFAVTAARLALSAGLLRGFLKRAERRDTFSDAKRDRTRRACSRWARPRERVLVTGNLKYDSPSHRRARLPDWLEAGTLRGFRASARSSSPEALLANEENSVLQAFAAVEREFPTALLILAPRKPEQFDNAAEIVARFAAQIAAPP